MRFLFISLNLVLSLLAFTQSDSCNPIVSEQFNFITEALNEFNSDSSTIKHVPSNIDQLKRIHHPIGDSVKFTVRKYDSEFETEHLDVFIHCDSKYEWITSDSIIHNLNRPIFFVHGLGGDRSSWSASADKLSNKFIYYPYLVDYSFHQNSFRNASIAAHSSMGYRLRQFNYDPSTGTGYQYYALPYAIGHSQGGLVLRDLDMKYSTGIDEPSLRGQRLFFGIITFGSPHAGASIVENMDELRLLGQDLGSSYLEAITTKKIEDIELGFPLRIFIDKVSYINDFSSLLEKIETQAFPHLLKVISQGHTDPITKQYAPESKYLNDTLNRFHNPCTFKALFYGIENEPVLWRMVHQSLNGVNSYGPFQANNDDSLVETIKIKQLELQALTINAQQKRQEYLAKLRLCNRRWGYVPLLATVGRWATCSNLRKQEQLYKESFSIYSNAYEQLIKANIRYKGLIGSYTNNEVTKDTLGWMKKVIITDTITFNGITNKIYQREVWTMVDSISKDSLIDSPNNYKLMIRNVLKASPSDGVVLARSQRAYPEVPEQYKHELIDFYGIGNQNHLQMRNSEATSRAMYMIFTADGSDIPEFFRLKKW